MEKRVTAKADKLSKVTRKRVSSRALIPPGRYPSPVQRNYADNVVAMPSWVQIPLCQRWPRARAPESSAVGLGDAHMSENSVSSDCLSSGRLTAWKCSQVPVRQRPSLLPPHGSHLSSNLSGNTVNETDVG